MPIETVVTLMALAIGLIGAMVGWIATGMRAEIRGLWRANAEQSKMIAATAGQIAVLVTRMNQLSCVRDYQNDCKTGSL